MVNYKQGKIYAIRSYQTHLCYIGSTTEKYLSSRYTSHKRCYDAYVNDKSYKQYCSSYEIMSFGDSYIILLENYSCNSIDELHKKEYEWINKLDCVNLVKKKNIIPNNYSKKTKNTYFKSGYYLHTKF